MSLDESSGKGRRELTGQRFIDQQWIIRADQVAPQSAGVFNVDQSGNASLVVQNLPVQTQIKAIAVTLEPRGGVQAPTGAKYLVGVGM